MAASFAEALVKAGIVDKTKAVEVQAKKDHREKQRNQQQVAAMVGRIDRGELECTPSGRNPFASTSS